MRPENQNSPNSARTDFVNGLLQPSQLHAHHRNARGHQVLVADLASGAPDQDRHSVGQACPLCHLPDGRGWPATRCLPRHSESDQWPAWAASDTGCCMMAATPTQLSSEADVGRSKAQHMVILAFCSKIAGIMYSASTNTALAPRLAAKTGLNDRVFVNNLTEGVSNGKCWLITMDGCKTLHNTFWRSSD